MKIEQLKEWGYEKLYDLAVYNFKNHTHFPIKENSSIMDFSWANSRENSQMWSELYSCKQENDRPFIRAKRYHPELFTVKPKFIRGIKEIQNGLLQET